MHKKNLGTSRNAVQHGELPPRTRLSSEKRQQEIIQAARYVFQTHGYESWTLADIARNAGVVEGTVLHYFKSKRNLITKVIEGFYADITYEMEEGLKGINGVRNQLKFVIYAHAKTLIDNTDLCLLMLKVARESDREIGVAIQECNKRYTRVIIDIVNEGKSNRQISESVSARLVRHVIFGGIEHYLWDRIYGKRNVDPNEIAEKLTELVYFGSLNDEKNINSEVLELIGKLNHLLQ